MNVAVRVGFALAILALVFGLVGANEAFLISGAILYGSSAIAHTISNNNQLV